ncbi:hypothetical protein PIB30_072672 [Stylosanthes scabra]|uniref:Uncharacterized protein n=1 Tax=Stylosanthes scabra TaxID=79078 RepID=A0ABU6TPA2_9FABA|nr:hypothetical protein [Stylosanthes scabra]
MRVILHSTTKFPSENLEFMIQEIEKLANLQRAKQIFRTLAAKDRSKRILIDGECRLPLHEESIVEVFVVVHEVVDDAEEEEEQRSLEWFSNEGNGEDRAEACGRGWWRKLGWATEEGVGEAV